MRNYNYASGGVYFVTICTHQREPLFGEIQEGQMILNDLGQIVDQEWQTTARLRSWVELDAYVVMPDHFHAILVLHLDSDPVGARRASPLPTPSSLPTPLPSISSTLSPKPSMSPTDIDEKSGVRKAVAGSLGSVIGAFKSAVTREINLKRNTPAFPVWQRNYFERVIRNDQELTLTREYIATNPLEWHPDEEYA